jgi:(E)-4-hydroxy-3-methylbut-2-enyl-diphosphate synthase
MVRVTVNTPEAARAVPEIKQRMLDAGCEAPLIGDFHYNGHLLLTRYPDAAKALDKYRINPGNVGTGKRRGRTVLDDLPGRGRESAACAHRREWRLPQSGAGHVAHAGKHGSQSGPDVGRDRERVHGHVGVAIDGTGDRVGPARRSDHHFLQGVSAASPADGLPRSRRKTTQPLHLGLTEAGMGIKGVAWSASALAILLNDGIGDTIRVSLTPRPGGDRREEVYAACEILQALGLRSFSPAITACPGCGRTTSTTFQELAERIQDYVRTMMPVWKTRHPGVEEMSVAVMGCVVNGPGESKAANIGISLPGTGESPNCPIYIDGQHVTTLRGTYDELASAFLKLVDDYVERKYPSEPLRTSNFELRT